MIIVNLVGPPAAGKSTFAARFILEHPQYHFFSIDAYRIAHNNEDLAWIEFEKDITSNNFVIMESSGLSYRLVKILNSEWIRNRHLLTVAFTAPIDVLHQRLTTRIKEQVPFPYKEIDEHMSIEFTLDNLHLSVAPIDIFVEEIGTSQKEIYSRLSQHIVEKSIEPRTRRKETFSYRLKP